MFLTTITAIGGLLPMMFAIEINFATREVTIGGPNASMWIQLSTAIVFGLAFSKMITLGLVPAMLALPYRRRERRRATRKAATGAPISALILRPEICDSPKRRQPNNQSAADSMARAIPGATSGSLSTSLSLSRAAAASFCLFHIEA